ncbi:MAG: Translation initiation factor 3 subunit J component [Sclerophora amabilis]|nr:MAG: Translation initiation factor 3 subunit J component [Sclerophora amabilis]
MAQADSQWDDEDSSTPPSSPPTTAAIPRRSKFEDEEENSDVLESWDAADDSEEEAAKAKQSAERKAKADAEAAANKKSKAERRAARIAESQARKEAEGEDTSSEEEDEAEKRERLRATEQDADLRHAEDLFGNIGISKNRSVPKAVVTQDPSNPDKTVDLSSLPLLNPTNKEGFTKLRENLAPIIAANSKKAQYSIFLPEFLKQIAKDLPSDQIKKLASALTTLSNEKLKEEKATEKSGKKTKAAKTKTSLVANRDTSSRADTTAYDEGYDDGDDFM